MNSPKNGPGENRFDAVVNHMRYVKHMDAI